MKVFKRLFIFLPLVFFFVIGCEKPAEKMEATAPLELDEQISDDEIKPEELLPPEDIPSNIYSRIGFVQLTTKLKAKLRRFPYGVALGLNHTCAIAEDHTLWCWGKNNSGQLGIGSNENKNMPTQVGSDIDWVNIAAGHAHTCGIKSNGELLCWGTNGFGQLGNGTTSSSNEPTPVFINSPFIPNKWLNVALGMDHTCAKGNDHKIRCWGLGSSGQLGNGRIENSQFPKLVHTSILSGHLYAGGSHNCYTDKDKFDLWCWGENGYGQLGDGSETDRPEPVEIEPVEEAWFDIDRDVNGFEGMGLGIAHTCGIDKYRRLWCWGYNQAGQLGDGTTENVSRPKYIRHESTPPLAWHAISAFMWHTCGKRQNSTVWCWGYNKYGQLGDGTTENKHVPVQIGDKKDWIGPYAGGFHTCAVDRDYILYCWGANDFGQLGDGTNVGKLSPVLVKSLVFID